MKKNKLMQLLLLLVVLLFAASCGKDGKIGPQGADGPQGAQGPQGPKGDPGQNGTKVYSGNTSPAETIGVSGDFYIDLTASLLYGPKTETGWGTAISIKGADGAAGANGADGTKIYSGATPPAATIGVVGDFYIDLSGGRLYGPKTSTGWGDGISLIGPPGNALGGNLPPVLNTIITPEILATLKSNGTIINEGLTPPTVNGIYLLSPNYCIFDNSGDNRANSVFADYKYKFSNQNNTGYSIRVDFEGISVDDSGSDVAATYLSGSGNLFTIYAQATGVDGGVNYTLLEIISGEVQGGNIKNFQLSNYMVSKGPDPSDHLEPANSTRIFEDEDGVSELQTTFAVTKKIIQSIGNKKPLSLQSWLKSNRKQ